jgi:hypothetical protein
VGPLEPQEIPGTLLLLLSAYRALRAADTSTFTWDVGYVLTATAAGLCKESFSLALPALALWRVLVNRFDAREPRQAPTFGQMSSGVGYLILVSDDFAAS